MKNSKINMKKEIPLFKVFMSKDAAKRASKVINSGFIGEGPQVKEFESELRRYFKTKETYDISTVNSATSAEHLLYHYLKKDRELIENVYQGVAFTSCKWDALKPTDEVLTTALTCTATNWPIINSGLKLKWVDIDPETLNMDLDALEKSIDKNTRVITVVHWGGNPIDLDRLKTIADNASEKYGRKVIIIEDCAHSFGSLYKGKNVGFTGNFGTFSLQAIKHITSGDGGFITSPYYSSTNDFNLLRWYGIDRGGDRSDFRCEADVAEAGFKYHMNDISAAIGRSNLEHADYIVNSNKSNGQYYKNNLKDVDGITLIKELDNVDPAYWLFSLHAERRDDLMKYLNENGVKSSRVHERNDLHTCTQQYKSYLPGVDKAVKSMLCIPVGYWVDQESREYIVDLIKKGW
tara:strand:- start:5414 stop:6631 length:1218 start_codon:yes stop_codon:yes gene_type:complete